MKNETRALNAELREGMVDMKYKRLRQDVSGVVEDTTEAERRVLFPWLWDVNNGPVIRYAPDGTRV